MIRTRYAPSPTGFMHVGNLRTALYAYLIAKHGNGKFLLRIEDTDLKRSVPGALEAIYHSLKLAGLTYDEGPDKDGGFGPYVQSQRLPIYKPYAEELVAKGEAYYCFCQKEEHESEDENELPVAGERNVCRLLNPEEAASRVARGEPAAIRQRIPDSGTTTYHDHILGDITFDNTLLDDQVLLKSDGFPTYNFANVIDDHLMEITHVVRGQEYISSTPKYSLLYQAFGWQSPVLVHCPLIVNEDGTKMSKRKGAPTLEQMVEMGFLPAAIVNYVSMLGWNPGTAQEIFSLEELVEVFNIDRINKSPAGFSMEKLTWMNGEHIRRLSLEEFHKLALPWYPDSVKKLEFDLEKLSKLIHVRTERLSAIPDMISFLAELPNYEPAMFVNDKSKSTLASSQEILGQTIPLLEALEPWTNEAVFNCLKTFAVESGFKVGTVMWPVRTACSGLEATPGGATELADLLGKEETLRRLRLGLAKLR
ncbi:MAG TPA: glutamate--tRNA ligase [Anaerolineaceae bacterium]|nr:glutamate--tRNA ligase [Anaerolineaceae bacterium]